MGVGVPAHRGAGMGSGVPGYSSVGRVDLFVDKQRGTVSPTSGSSPLFDYKITAVAAGGRVVIPLPCPLGPGCPVLELMGVTRQRPGS